MVIIELAANKAVVRYRKYGLTSGENPTLNADSLNGVIDSMAAQLGSVAELVDGTLLANKAQIVSPIFMPQDEVPDGVEPKYIRWLVESSLSAGQKAAALTALKGAVVDLDMALALGSQGVGLHIHSRYEFTF